VERQIAALLCRTSERDASAAAGTRELAQLLGARIIGSPGRPDAAAGHADDLRSSRGCLLEAGGQVDDALEAGRIPILLAGECSVCVSTLPVAVRRRPGVRVLWLDAHPDFNTPATSASGYLGGMCLAGACGLWDTGFGAGLDPGRVIMFGVRDVDGPERVALDRNGVHRLGDPAQLEGMELFVHVDLDVLDPEFHPARVPAPLGLAPEALREVLAYAAGEATLVGAEITSAAPGYAQVAADAIAPLLAYGAATA
jgi:arginase